MRSLLLLPFLLACSEQRISPRLQAISTPIPLIEVEPRRIDFPSLGSGEAVTQAFRITNIGGGRLEVLDLAFGGSDSFSLLDVALPFGIFDGEERWVEVRFAPLDPREHAAEVRVRSDDPDRPDVPVALTGGGLVPRLRILPEDHDFGELAAGCATGVDLVLQNIGLTDLVLDGASLAHDGAFAVEGDFDTVLAPLDWIPARVTWEPTVEGEATAVLSVASNDPRGTATARQAGIGRAGEAVTDRFVAPVEPPVDLLFAIDQSCSMEDDAENLAREFGHFVEMIGLATSNWHLGVVSRDSGCFNGGVLTADTPDLTARFSAAVVDGVGEDHTFDEALLQLSHRALSSTASGRCNQGFLRAGAHLHVLVVSDEPERSTEFAAAWTWDYWVERIRGFVASPSHLTLSGVVDRDGCNEGDQGYAEAIRETGGAYLSICSDDWAGHVAALADASVARLHRFLLSEEPVPGSIVVLVDGVAREDGWHHDPRDDSLQFDTLRPGADVEVRYQRRRPCR